MKFNRATQLSLSLSLPTSRLSRAFEINLERQSACERAHKHRERVVKDATHTFPDICVPTDADFRLDYRAISHRGHHFVRRVILFYAARAITNARARGQTGGISGGNRDVARPIIGAMLSRLTTTFGFNREINVAACALAVTLPS